MNLADLAPIAYPWLEAFHVIAVIASSIDAGFAEIALEPELHSSLGKPDDAGGMDGATHQRDYPRGGRDRPALELLIAKHAGPAVKNLDDVSAWIAAATHHNERRAAARA